MHHWSLNKLQQLKYILYFLQTLTLIKRYQLPGVITRRCHYEPSPIHPSLHANSAFNLMNTEFFFYMARYYVKRGETFHSSISSLNLNLTLKRKYKIEPWNSVSQHCNVGRINNEFISRTNIYYIKSYNHTIRTIHSHTIHTSESHIIFRIHLQQFTLTSNFHVKQ